MDSWIIYTWRHAKKNGWEPFFVQDGEDTIEMQASMMYMGNWIYEGSVSELVPKGVQITMKDAIALSYQRWSIQENRGTRPDLYIEFELQQQEQKQEKQKQEKQEKQINIHRTLPFRIAARL